MIEFRAITTENFDIIVKMIPPKGYEGFVPSAAEAMAEAWLYNDPEHIHPAAIYADGKPVGFIQLSHGDESNRCLVLWHLLFPEENVNRGYGGETIRLLARLARESGRFDEIGLVVDSSNHRAIRVYEREGFRADPPPAEWSEKAKEKYIEMTLKL